MLSKSHALIEKEPKQTEDPQFAENALSEFRSSTKELIDEFRIKLILAIVGREEPGMEVLTSQNDPERDPAVAFLRKKFAEFNLRVSKLQTSNEMQSIQIGLGPDERGFRREQVVSGIVDLIGQMNMVLGSVEGDEGAGGVLD